MGKIIDLQSRLQNRKKPEADMPGNGAARKFIFARAKIQISIFLTNVAK